MPSLHINSLMYKGELMYRNNPGRPPFQKMAFDGIHCHMGSGHATHIPRMEFEFAKRNLTRIWIPERVHALWRNKEKTKNNEPMGHARRNTCDLQNIIFRKNVLAKNTVHYMFRCGRWVSVLRGKTREPAPPLRACSANAIFCNR